jgi:hypothetical protein
MKRVSAVTKNFFELKDGQTRKNFEATLISDRRDLLSDILARCHHYPDAPLLSLIPFMHEMIEQCKM